MESVEERLARLETQLNELNKKIDNITEMLERKAELNGKQNISIATLETRLAAVEEKLRAQSKWLFSTLGAVVSSILYSVVRYFTGG